MSIFESARDYDFYVLQRYLEDGGDINVCDENGCSLLTCFVDGYFDCPELLSVEEKQMYADHPEDDYAFWDQYVFVFQNTPLEKRNCKIFEQLETLFSYGADPNLCVLTKGMTETALMLAVCQHDYYLTKYLLEKGADPGVWLFEPDEHDLSKGKEYWLMDEIDIAIMNGDRGEAAALDLSIAQLLWQYGLTDWNGFCIDIDKENGVIAGHSLQVLF